MQHNKDIDRLFQEKFRDFEMQPNPEVWEVIENNLKENKKRKPLVLWFRIAGVAAILLLLFSVGKEFFNQKNDIVVNSIKNDAINRNNNVSEQNNVLEQKQGNKIKKNLITINNVSKLDNNEIKPKQNEIVMNQNKLAIIYKNNNDAVEKTVTIIIPKLKNSIKQQNFNKDISVKNDKKSESKTLIKDQVKQGKSLVVNKENKKLNIQEELIETTEKEEKINIKKFSVGTSYSPIYYASLTKGSSIDKSITNSSSSKEFSSSYGVKFEYKINEKWSIQTGIHNMELVHTTKDVNVSIVEPTISFNNQFSNLEVTNEGKRIDVSPVQGSSFELSPLAILSTNGNIQQNTGYLEVPIEVKYSIMVAKKINVQLLGGLSTLFLNENEVLLDNTYSTFTLGEASNLNKINFSANLGVDLNYNISKKWFINLSPSFKYQINTYSERSGGFKPYLISVNTGLNFRF